MATLLALLEDTLQAQPLCPPGFGSGSWARWRFGWPCAFSSLPSWTVLSDSRQIIQAQVPRSGRQ